MYGRQIKLRWHVVGCVATYVEQTCDWEFSRGQGRSIDDGANARAYKVHAGHVRDNTAAGQDRYTSMKSERLGMVGEGAVGGFLRLPVITYGDDYGDDGYDFIVDAQEWLGGHLKPGYRKQTSVEVKWANRNGASGPVHYFMAMNPHTLVQGEFLAHVGMLVTPTTPKTARNQVVTIRGWLTREDYALWTEAYGLRTFRETLGPQECVPMTWLRPMRDFELFMRGMTLPTSQEWLDQVRPNAQPQQEPLALEPQLVTA